jgi:hypothetical protein
VEFVVDAQSRQRVQMDLFVAPPAPSSSTVNGAWAAHRPLLKAN